MLAILSGKVTVKDMAKRFKLEPEVVQGWCDASMRELSRTLAAAPAPPKAPAALPPAN